MNVDRRVVRTRNALYDGLVSLILRKDYDKISIEDILGAANVSRSTFYAHFASKDELLERSMERLRDELVKGRDGFLQARATGEDIGWSYSLGFLEHVAEYKRVYDVVVSERAGAILLKGLHDVLVGYLKDSPDLPSMDGVPRELMTEYVAQTLLTVMKWWLDRKPSLSPSEIDAIFCRLIRVTS